MAAWLLLLLYLPAALAAACPLPLLRIANVPEALWGGAIGYLRFLFAGAFFVGLKGLLAGFLQGHGDSGVPGFLAAASVVSQTALTLLCSVSWNMGAAGSAAAVMANNLIFCALLGLYAWKTYGLCSILPPREIPQDAWLELRRNIRAKTGLMMLLWLGSFVFSREVNRLPQTVIAANAYVSAINDVCMEIVFAYGTAAMVAAGQNYGSKERRPGHYRAMIRHYIRSFLIQGEALSAVFLALAWTGGERLIRWLAGGDAPDQLVGTAAMLLRIISLGYPALAVLLICRCALQSMGQYQAQLLLGILAVCISLVCACFVPQYGAPVIGICIFLKLLVPGCCAGVAYMVFMKKR